MRENWNGAPFSIRGGGHPEVAGWTVHRSRNSTVWSLCFLSGANMLIGSLLLVQSLPVFLGTTTTPWTSCLAWANATQKTLSERRRGVCSRIHRETVCSKLHTQESSTLELRREGKPEGKHDENVYKDQNHRPLKRIHWSWKEQAGFVLQGGVEKERETESQAFQTDLELTR